MTAKAPERIIRYPEEICDEIGRRYELGRQNRTKVLCAEFRIAPVTLLKMAAAYRRKLFAKQRPESVNGVV